MAFADPLSVTIDTVAHSMPRIKSDGYRSEYLEDDESHKLTISHQESKGRTRRLIRLDIRVVAADPLTSVNEYKTLGVYLVIDEPEYGFADADIVLAAEGFMVFLNGANVLEALLTQQH